MHSKVINTVEVWWVANLTTQLGEPPLSQPLSPETKDCSVAIHKLEPTVWKFLRVVYNAFQSD